MSTEKEEEEEGESHHPTNQTQKRNSIESTSSSDQDPSNRPKPVEGRIPKRQKKLPKEEEDSDDPVVVQARKALEMFQELEAEDIPILSSSLEEHPNKMDETATKIATLGPPEGPKIHHRIPIISQQEELLL